MPVEDLRARLCACDLCPRRCGANRNAGIKGLCGNDATPAVYQHFMHYGEEISIVPAFIINMSGCSLQCPTCSERCHFFEKALPVGTPAHYAGALAAHLRRTGLPASIEWIGGEPSCQLPFVLETSAILREKLQPCPPILLNTNGYFDTALLDAMHEILDGFVFDLKCAPSCQQEITGASDYWTVVTANIRAVAAKFPGSHIIRHLVMPGHLECCTKPVLAWCRDNAPQMIVNVMTGFQDFRAQSACRQLDDAQKAAAAAIALELVPGRRMVDGKWV